MVRLDNKIEVESDQAQARAVVNPNPTQKDIAIIKLTQLLDERASGLFVSRLLHHLEQTLQTDRPQIRLLR